MLNSYGICLKIVKFGFQWVIKVENVHVMGK